MDDFLKMDIFFLVTTIATVVITVLVSIGLLHCIHILKVFRRLAKEFEEEAHAVRSDFTEARLALKREGVKVAHLFESFQLMAKQFVSKKPPAPQRRAKKKKAPLAENSEQ